MKRFFSSLLTVLALAILLMIWIKPPLAALTIGTITAASSMPDTVSYTHLDVYKRQAYDRKDAPWADAAGLDTLWRQSVKNDWLRLKLAGKPADEIRKTLDKRYANLLTSVQQLKGCLLYTSRCV